MSKRSQIAKDFLSAFTATTAFGAVLAAIGLALMSPAVIIVLALFAAAGFAFGVF